MAKRRVGRHEMQEVKMVLSQKILDLSNEYSDLTKTRAAIQLIPHVGSALDTLLSGEGAKFQQNRINEFIQILYERLSHIEAKFDTLATEEFFDFIRFTFESVAKSKSRLKRERFVSIIEKKIKSDHSWNEAELATRLLSNLTDEHISILLFATAAPICQSPFEGLRVIKILDRHYGRKEHAGPKPISDCFPQMPLKFQSLLCSDLVSNGLLKDDGVGRMDTKAMELFVVTDLGEWFLAWIKNPEN